jgi:hypothetical protein
VLALEGEVNVTLPGPLTFVQALASAAPNGNPSSATVPFNVTTDGSVIVCAVPALTNGARLAGLTTTVTSANPLSNESLAVSRSV